MSNTTGSTRDLGASKKEALQGLLSSLGHSKDDPAPDAKLSAEQVRKLSEKINEILGEGVPTQWDEPNQLLSEDGLPIIDISEPVYEGAETNTLVPEQEFVPLSLLPPDERERRRRDRDRILDLLEEEERLQQLKEERDAEEERKEEMKKRKESVKAELEQLKAARELQKKMGRAIVQHVTKRTGEEEMRSKLQPASPGAKKSVSFADTPAAEVDLKDQQTSTHQPDWGEVTLGRLRAQNRIPLVSAVEAQKYPMKMHVLERSPATPFSISHVHTPDSDDEPSSAEFYRMETSSSDEEEKTSGDDSSEEEPLEEEFDYDAAQHHREIALEYHKKRHAIGAETLAAHALDDYEQQEIPNEQSPFSRFRADRMAAAYDKSHAFGSISIEQTVIPASRVRSLQSAVKLGKLDNDQLVGDDSRESGSEDEAVKEVIQMLQPGSVRNADPDFKPPPMSTTAPQTSDDMESATRGMSTTRGVMPSGSGLTRGTGTTESITVQDNTNRWQPAISSVVERRAPRSSSAKRFPINKAPPQPPIKESTFPTIIDSPSFPMTANMSTVVPSSFPPRLTTAGSPSSHQTHPERLSQVDSIATQVPIAESQVSPRDTVTKPISKFMAARRGL